jgi:hypothetical protein
MFDCNDIRPIIETNAKKEIGAILSCQINSRDGDQKDRPAMKIIPPNNERIAIREKQILTKPILFSSEGRNLIIPIGKPTLQKDAIKAAAENNALACPTCAGAYNLVTNIQKIKLRNAETNPEATI